MRGVLGNAESRAGWLQRLASAPRQEAGSGGRWQQGGRKKSAPAPVDRHRHRHRQRHEYCRTMAGNDQEKDKKGQQGNDMRGKVGDKAYIAADPNTALGSSMAQFFRPVVPFRPTTWPESDPITINESGPTAGLVSIQAMKLPKSLLES